MVKERALPERSVATEHTAHLMSTVATNANGDPNM